MSKNRHVFFRGMMVRILFYGLFLVGPCALTESHALHVRMKQKCPIVDDKATDGETYREYHRKEKLLDIVGMSAFVLWFAWLGLALGGQIKHIVQERRLKRNRKSAIIFPRNNKP